MKDMKALLKFIMIIFKIVFEAKYKSIHEEGLNSLTPKQMLQRLPIALAHVKAVNTPLKFKK